MRKRKNKQDIIVDESMDEGLSANSKNVQDQSIPDSYCEEDAELESFLFGKVKEPLVLSPSRKKENKLLPASTIADEERDDDEELLPFAISTKPGAEVILQEKKYTKDESSTEESFQVTNIFLIVCFS